MNLICKIWGHNYDSDLDFHGPWNCTRCDHVCDPYSEEEYDSKSLDLGWKLINLADRVFSWTRYKFRWFLKCPGCGKRFNKHTNDCAPF